MGIKIDFTGVATNWRDEQPTEKQLNMAYKYCPRRTVDRWLSENRTKGFFSMIVGYIFESHIQEGDVVDWDEVAHWYDHPELEG